MKKRLEPLFAGLLIVLCFVAVRADGLDKFIAGQIRTRKIPGLSVAVIRDGKIVRAAGYGLANLELQVPATKDTVYEIGSISKQFASEALMLLVEDGKVNLDDPINKYLPANASDSWAKIAVRDLLNHTSGLKDWTEIKDFSYRREYSAEEFVSLVRDFPLLFAPRERWSYSNTNLPLVGIIVERASGKTYEEFVTERIIKPLALPSIRFKHQEDVVANRATGYVLRDGAWRNGEPFRPKVIAPSGGMLATAVDLARWWEAVLGGKIVKETSLEQMLAPARLNDGRTVAHGFAFFTDTFNGHKGIFHHGSTVGGFGAVVRRFPHEKLTIAVIGNLEDGGFGPEYISKRIADFYIPGAFIGGLKETKEETPGQTDGFLQLLKDIAGGKNSALLTASYAARISDDFRRRTNENLDRMKSFVYLGREKITPDHFVLDPTLTDVFYYRMTLADRDFYYHFRVDKNSRVGFIVTED
ncbi:MAG: beta-lactamase family protein [Acidobacteria bacterium]|nr:beta-lactamase family protein [Acidobacteriota bacterium]